MSSLLEIDKLSVTFRLPTGPVTAVKDVSFTIAEGETLALVGESGSGKSVTSTAAMRLLPELAETTGAIRFNGENLLEVTPKRMRRVRGNDISMIFQEPMTSLNPLHRIGRQIGEVLVKHKQLTGNANRQRVLELLNQVGIPEPERRIDSYPYELSGGQRQRVAIARALVNHPSIILADEPTGNLDSKSGREIMDIFDALYKAGNTIILVTHEDYIASHANRTIRLFDGKVQEDISAAA